MLCVQWFFLSFISMKFKLNLRSLSYGQITFLDAQPRFDCAVGRVGTI